MTTETNEIASPPSAEGRSRNDREYKIPLCSPFYKVGQSIGLEARVHATRVHIVLLVKGEAEEDLGGGKFLTRLSAEGRGNLYHRRKTEMEIPTVAGTPSE
jgi:hypothetical protein